MEDNAAKPPTRTGRKRPAAKTTATNPPPADAPTAKPATKAAAPARKPAARKTTKAAPRPVRVEPPAAPPVAAPPVAAPPVAPPPGDRVTDVPAPAPATTIDAGRSAAAPDWLAFTTHPAYVAELLALAAVARFGPEAAAGVAQLRDTTPDATPDDLARVLTGRFVREASTGAAIAAFGGPFAVFADLTATNTVHARVVLHLAAAYGFDPADPERAAELLVLQGVHDDVEAARAALRASGQPGDWPRSGGSMARAMSIGTAQLATRASAWLVPGAAVLVGALASARSTEGIAARAAEHYRAGIRSS